MVLCMSRRTRTECLPTCVLRQTDRHRQQPNNNSAQDGEPKGTKGAGEAMQKAPSVPWIAACPLLPMSRKSSKKGPP